MNRHEINVEIIKKMQQGNIEAFNQVFEIYKNKVYFYSLSMTNNWADSEDITQNVFVKVYDKSHTLDNPQMFHAWVCRITYHETLNYLKQKKRKQAIEFNEEYMTLSGGIDPIKAMESNNINKIIYEVIQKMPPKYLNIALLYFLQELTVQEIHEITAIPITTIRRRIRKSQEILKDSLMKKGYKPENYYDLSIVLFLVFVFNDLSKQFGIDQKVSDKMRKTIPNQSQHGISTPNHTSLWEKVVEFMTTNISSGLAVGITLMSVVAFGIVQHNIANGKQQYTYLGEISYNTNVTNQPIEVTTTMLTNIAKNNISIKYENSEILDFSLNNDEIIFWVNKNGAYTIIANQEEKTIQINNYDADAIGIKRVYWYENYLQLKLSGNVQRFNQDDSYVLYKGKQYPIELDLTVQHQFEGELLIVLVDTLGNTIEYKVNTNNTKTIEN